MEKSIYGFIWRYSKRQQLIITLITVASFPFLYYSLELPKIIVNDALKGKHGFPVTYLGIEMDQKMYLVALCMVFLLMLLANAFFLQTVNTYKNQTSERMTRRLRFMLYQRILRFPLPHFQRVSQGELSTMLAGEVELIREFIADAIALPVFQGGTLLVILFFMFAQDPILGAASVALIPFQAWIIPKLQRRINLLNKDRVNRARALSGRVGESVSGIRDIRANNAAVFTQADFSRHLEGLYKVRYELFRLKYFMKALNVFMLKLTPFLFYLVGGLLIIDGRLTVGSLVAALAAYNNLTTPWKELLKYYQRRGDADIKYEQLVASFELPSLLSEKKLDHEEAGSERLNGPVAFENVTVIDDDGAKTLDKVSFNIRPGGRLAVVSGAIGRDKLAQSMTNMLTPTEGRILIADRPLSSYSDKTIGTRMAYAGADSYIFDGTVGYNTEFSLQHRVPVKPDGGTYDLAEAIASGNSPYDIHQNWRDLGIAACASEDDFANWWFDVIKAVELEESMFQRALGSFPDLSRHPGLAEKIFEARNAVLERLRADPELAPLVNHFYFDDYNPTISVGSNLLFGEPRNGRFAFNRLGQNSFVRSILREAGIEAQFRDIGLEVAREVVELFGDADADAGLMERFAFIDPLALDRLRRVVNKVREHGAARLGDNDVAELISLTAQLIPQRHRFGRIDEAFQAKLVEARRLLHERIPEDLKSGIAFYDPNAFNDCLHVRANLLMGRVTQARANSEQRVDEMIRDVLTEHGLFRDIVMLARDVEVGIAGQRLPTAARQCLALARAVIKRPDILVVNDALGSLDREARDRIRKNIAALLSATTLIWIDGEMPNAAEFDEVLVLRNGRVQKRIVDAREEVVSAEEGEEAGATPFAIQAEAAALARVPLFSEINPTDLKLLAFGSKRVTFESGEDIMKQGLMGDTAYVVLSGDVEIVLNQGQAGERVVARLGKDSLIGETSLLATVPRTAGARAFSRVDMLQIDKEPFLQIVRSDPKVAANVARIASERLASTLSQMQKAA
ncbi:MAG: ABC transporter transmembrane domain-containing protein [Hyphomicrobiales bacterium]